MHKWKVLLFALAVAVFLSFSPFNAVPEANAQVAVGVNIGPAPVCPYGYFDYAPYNCAPYGYYGPEWFVDGAFIGVGPWFHGPAGFHGHVNNRFDPNHGYHGRLPAVNERAVHSAPPARFKGNEARDGMGHAVDEHGGRR
jgi:hypothetical protein